MTYKVKYKLHNQLFWRKLKKVTGDSVFDRRGNKDSLVGVPPTMCFEIEDTTRVEVPIVGTMFEFSKERFLIIKKNMEKEAGLKIVTGKDNGD